MTPEVTHPDRPNVLLNCLCIIVPVALTFLSGLVAPPLFVVGAIYAIFLVTRKSVHSRQSGWSILIGTLIASILWCILFYQWIRLNAAAYPPNPTAPGNGATVALFHAGRSWRAVPEQIVRLL